MMIAYLQKKMLFEIRPDIFPDFLCDTERILWGMFLDANPKILGLR